MALPWVLNRAGTFNLFILPERIDSIFGFHNGGSMIAKATGNKSLNVSSTATPGLSAMLGTATAVQETNMGMTGGLLSYLGQQHVRSFGGVFTYLTSKWAFACVTLVSPQ